MRKVNSMAELILDAEVRNKTGKGDAKKLRAVKRVPAVIYGKDVTPVHCSLDRVEFEKKVRLAQRNALFDIKLSGGESKKVIVRDYQKHPLLHEYTHIDFQAVDLKQPIKVDVDVDFIGTPVGKKLGGIFTASCKEIKIECLPEKIPAKIQLDITNMEAGESLHVSDIKSDFTILTNPKVALCQVSKVKEEEEAAEGEEGATEEAAAAPAEGK